MASYLFQTMVAAWPVVSHDPRLDQRLIFAATRVREVKPWVAWNQAPRAPRRRK